MKLAVVLLGFTAVAGLNDPPDGGFSRTLSVTGPVDLRVQTDSGRISIRPGASDRVEVAAKIRVSRRHREEGLENLRHIEANPPIEQHGNVLRMGYFSTPNADRYLSIDWDVIVPSSTTIESRTDSGSQLIERVTGPVRASSDSGSLRLEDLSAPVTAATDSGGIEVSVVRGALTARSDSGTVRASGVAGALDVSTDSGTVALEQTAGGEVRIQTDSGRVTLRVPLNVGYDVSAKSDSGTIRIDPPITVRGKLSQHHLEGKLRGGGHRMVIETDSGSIDVEQ